MADRFAHSRAHAAAISGGVDGRAELVDRLSTMRFGEIDPRLLAQLSAEQRMALLSSVAGADALPAPAKQALLGESSRKARTTITHRHPLRSIFEALPRLVQGLVAGALTASIVGGLAVAALQTTTVLSPYLGPRVARDVRLWPPCRRLDRHVDACVYTVERQIATMAATDLLGVDHTEFLRLNRLSTKAPALTRGHRVIVWRGARPLAD